MEVKDKAEERIV